MNIDQFSTQIMESISHGDTITAIRLFDSHVNPNSLVYEEIILLESNLNKCSKEYRIGTLSRESRDLEVRKINAALLEILNNLKPRDFRLYRNEKLVKEELSDPRFELIDNIIKENKRLKLKISNLEAEIEHLKVTDPRLALVNYVEFYYSPLFSYFNGLGKTMKMFVTKIEEDLNRIDPGFCKNQIDKLDKNLPSLTRLTELLAQITGQYNLKAPTAESQKRRFLEFKAIDEFCVHQLTIDGSTIERVIDRLEDIYEDITNRGVYIEPD